MLWEVVAVLQVSIQGLLTWPYRLRDMWPLLYQMQDCRLQLSIIMLTIWRWSKSRQVAPPSSSSCLGVVHQEFHQEWRALACTRPSSFHELRPWRTSTTVLAFSRGRGVRGSVALRKSIAPPVKGRRSVIIDPPLFPAPLFPFTTPTPFVAPNQSHPNSPKFSYIYAKS